MPEAHKIMNESIFYFTDTQISLKMKRKHANSFHVNVFFWIFAGQNQIFRNE